MSFGNASAAAFKAAALAFPKSYPSTPGSSTP